MTYYADQVTEITKRVYPKGYLTKRVIQAKHFMDRYYGNPIDQYTISREASLSKFHFLRIFKKYYGITPNNYLAQVRVEHARELLASGTSVTQACFAVGFSSVTTFAGLFKKLTGVSPYTFQKQKLKKAILKRSKMNTFATFANKSKA